MENDKFITLCQYANLYAKATLSNVDERLLISQIICLTNIKKSKYLAYEDIKQLSESTPNLLKMLSEPFNSLEDWLDDYIKNPIKSDDFLNKLLNYLLDYFKKQVDFLQPITIHKTNKVNKIKTGLEELEMLKTKLIDGQISHEEYIACFEKIKINAKKIEDCTAIFSRNTKELNEGLKQVTAQITITCNKIKEHDIDKIKIDKPKKPYYRQNERY